MFNVSSSGRTAKDDQPPWLAWWELRRDPRARVDDSGPQATAADASDRLEPFPHARSSHSRRVRCGKGSTFVHSQPADTLRSAHLKPWLWAELGDPWPAGPGRAAAIPRAPWGACREAAERGAYQRGPPRLRKPGLCSGEGISPTERLTSVAKHAQKAKSPAELAARPGETTNCTGKYVSETPKGQMPSAVTARRAEFSRCPVRGAWLVA
jgi:hypothetical protein